MTRSRFKHIQVQTEPYFSELCGGWQRKVPKFGHWGQLAHQWCRNRASTASTNEGTEATGTQLLLAIVDHDHTIKHKAMKPILSTPYQLTAPNIYTEPCQTTTTWQSTYLKHHIWSTTEQHELSKDQEEQRPTKAGFATWQAYAVKSLWEQGRCVLKFVRFYYTLWFSVIWNICV